MNIQEVYNKLIKKIPMESMKIDEPMSQHTTFKLGGKADIFIRVKDIEQLKYIFEVSKQSNIPTFILGNGSNILVRDEGIRGIVIKPDFDDIAIERKETYALVTVGSGITLPKLAQILLKEKITGLEFASGIPGTIGGAVKLNAGAFKKEMKDVLYETTFMDANGEIYTINNEQHEFEYRKSIFFSKEVIIVSAVLKLEYGNPEEIKHQMDTYMEIRLEKQPYTLPNAGSIFKRGEDYITAKLIDDAGLKGYKIGGAEVSTLHSGFIINNGNATAQDVIDLIEYIKKRIKELYEKDIKLEIEIIG